MSRHLDDDQIAAALTGAQLDESAAEHLACCIDCRRQVTSLQELIEDRRREMAAEEPDWDDQRQRILSRFGETAHARPRRRWMRPVLAAAAVIALAVGVGLMQLPNGGGPDREIAVEEILAEAEALLDDDSIPGFEAIDPGLEGWQELYENGAS
jgi:predicted anti-sigma-YlaC factor YlaD